MESMLLYDRLQFAATVIFHYLFPQLTMGLALLLFYFKSRALWSGNEHYNEVTRFWTKIFAITFAFGVVTGIPMEFQFGTNWGKFSEFAGGVIGQTLAMEGTFAFFLESSFLGVMLFSEKRLGQKIHWFATLMVFLGSWLSAFFILATDAWMQHPTGYVIGPNGAAHLSSFWGLVLNPWLLWQYLHNMAAAVVTGAFVVAGLGAFYLLSSAHVAYAKTFLRTGVVVAAIASLLLIFPTGDGESRQVFAHQPAKAAAMEGLFHTQAGAPLVIIGQPNMQTQTLDNPIILPDMLSFLTYRRFTAEVQGLDAFPQTGWPDRVPLVYYAYHIMVGLGTIFAAVMVTALFLLWRGRLFQSRWLLWLIMLVTPFPYIATTAGWTTAEAGRQPWLVYGLMRTADGVSPLVNAGNALFTFLGFLGLYLAMGLLYVFLILNVINHGPTEEAARASVSGAPVGKMEVA